MVSSDYDSFMFMLLSPTAPSAHYFVRSIFLFDFNYRDRDRKVADEVRVSSARWSKFSAELMRTSKKGLSKWKSNIAQQPLEIFNVKLLSFSRRKPPDD
jgi:hypothetical protein